MSNFVSTMVLYVDSYKTVDAFVPKLECGFGSWVLILTSV